MDAEEVCIICKTTDNDDLMLICDTCDFAHHTYCLGLTAVPRGESWRCPDCATRDAGVAASALRSKLL